jgi:hypothetical protein
MGMLTNDDLDNRFDYHPPVRESIKSKHERVRDISKQYADFLNSWVPPGRELSLAITKIEEAMMWANAGIARDQDAEQVGG